jgi:hypothetical protein
MSAIAGAGRRTLPAILVLAALLRVAPILWGIPITAHVRPYHPDEAKSWRTVEAFPRVYVTDQRFRSYGTAVAYTLGVLLLPVRAVLVGVLDEPRLYSGVCWLAFRLAAVACGVATVYVGHRLARRLFDRTTAILAAALIATSFYHVLNSPLATVDVPMSFLLVLNFYLCLRAFEAPSVARFAGLGVASGLLVGTKITGGLFALVPFTLAALASLPAIQAAGLPRLTGARRLRLLGAYVAAALAVFAIYHPHVFLEASRHLERYASGSEAWVERTRVPLARVPGIWLEATVTAVGLPVLALAIGGAAAMGRRLWPHKAALLAFVALYYAGWRWFLPPRFLIPVAPILAIFAAAFCGRLLASRRAAWRGLGLAAASVALSYSIYLCVSGIRIRLGDSRPAAARYIAEVLPWGGTLAFSQTSETYPWQRHRWRYPAVDSTRHRLVRMWEQPELLVVSSYDLNPIRRALRSDKLLAGYRWDPEWNRDWYRNSPPSPRIFRFFDDLLNGRGDYRLVASFSTPVTVPIEFPPPEIWIYRRESAGSRSQTRTRLSAAAAASSRPSGEKATS